MSNTACKRLVLNCRDRIENVQPVADVVDITKEIPDTSIHTRQLGYKCIPVSVRNLINETNEQLKYVSPREESEGE